MHDKIHRAEQFRDAAWWDQPRELKSAFQSGSLNLRFQFSPQDTVANQEELDLRESTGQLRRRLDHVPMTL